jgi:hypothetical protein
LTAQWLECVDCFSRTGMARDHVRFGGERQDKESIRRNPEIGFFIDDREHVMPILRRTVPHLYFFQDESNKKHRPPWATDVSNRNDLYKMMIRDAGKLLGA